VEEELLVEGEERDQELGSEVRDEKEDDPGISRLPMAFSVRLRACSTISMVHTLWCWWEGEGEVPPADKLRLSSRLDSSSEELGKAPGLPPVLLRLTVLRSSSCRFQSCLPVEKDSSCCAGGLLARPHPRALAHKVNLPRLHNNRKPKSPSTPIPKCSHPKISPAKIQPTLEEKESRANTFKSRHFSQPEGRG
jgi:hypothetical protein